MTSPSTNEPRIAIVGGGPAGLVLHLTLHRHGIPSTLYERESSPDSHSHLGGMLDLGWFSGQRALRENGINDAFMKYARPDGEELRMCDKAGNLLLHSKPEKDQNPLDSRPEIDRNMLRKILLDAVPANSVKWAYALSSVRPLGQGHHELTFTNGFTVISDILIGADGAFSRIRPLVSSATPLYTGFTGTEISISPEVAARPDMTDVVSNVGQGSAYAQQDSKFFGTQLNGDGRIRAYVFHASSSEWKTPSEPAEVRKVLLEMFEDWAPWIRKFIENIDDGMIYHRALYYLPIRHQWDHVPGVTIIGDAAHLMSPFAGAGANLAMLDAFELGHTLSEAIIEGKTVEEREAAVAAWEVKMWNRAERMARISKSNLENFIGPDAPEGAVQAMKSFPMKPSMRRYA
ncbi:FAD/NAD(P)-binding domain-containing protein [Fomes fomentarius]|nr:FAD/NAD(P)-binding domain-containing protein [Fomes fomentarius]